LTKADHILLLVGTHEARLLAREIAGRFPGLKVTASFAGAVSDLPDLGVPTRVGGFGGAEGLAQYLKEERVSVLVDATHPFAARISRNAVAASKSAGIPLLRLERPAWMPSNGDNWLSFPSLEAATEALPAGARVFFSIGRKEIGQVTHRHDLFGLVRMIEAPEAPLPGHWHLVLARPPQSPEDEVVLMTSAGITHLVTRNSGGTRAHAKIAAARDLGLPVLMVERPELPPAPSADSIDNLLQDLRSVLAS
jgi:precorrin-6A/cobalt-precorrin-6A reductase